MNTHTSKDYQKADKIASSKAEKICSIAGPGTGKSFSMKKRIERLLEEGVRPEQILAVTFTNVAANNLHQELVNMSVTGADRLKVRTLHSLATEMLYRDHVCSATGRFPRFMLDDYELEPLIADLSAHGGDDKIKHLVESWLNLETVRPDGQRDEELNSFKRDLKSWLIFHRAMLLNEIIPETRNYLEKNPAVEERSEFKHILVDEYQDLNKYEQDFLALLADGADVCIIGDDDQSIYSFKQANPSGLRDCKAPDSGYEPFDIDDCFRCPTSVVSIANSLIEHNKDRITKHLKPVSENGEGLINICQFDDLQQEISGVTEFVKQCIEKEGISAGDILILNPINRIVESIYKNLLGAGVPAKSYSREPVLEDYIAKEKFALFTLLSDKEDRVSLRWLLGAKPSMWYPRDYEKIKAYCNENDKSPFQVLNEQRQGAIEVSDISNLQERFNEIIAQINELDSIDSVYEQVNNLFPEGEKRLKKIRDEALNFLKRNEDCSLKDINYKLRRLFSGGPEAEDNDRVRIMTLHKSKGLSSPITIITGCAEGLLPNWRNPQNEEQRRLFYVGLTRVEANSPEGNKKGVLIITSSRKMPFGRGYYQPSKFLSELGGSAPLQQRAITITPEDILN